MIRLPASRAMLAPDEQALVDEYFISENPARLDYHVVAAFVLADREPPTQAGLSGADSKLVQDHYKLYRPNGVDDDGLAGVPDLEAVR